MKHAFWVLANIYGRIFGRRYLAKFHHGLVVFFLHALGYDNGWKPAYTGEEWFLRSVLMKMDPQICLDVGGSIGNYSRELLRITAASVYALEPTPTAFIQLKKLEKDYPDRLHAIETAVSNFDGKTTFYLEGERSERNSLSKEGLFDPREHMVNVTTLDAFTRSLDRVDFIKVDTEGFEREVFEGMQETLKHKHPKAVQFEFNILHLWRGHTLLSLTKLLEGYVFYRLLPRGLIRIHPERFVDNIFIFSNIVAIREDLQI